MDSRMEEIFNNSNDLYEEFVQQQLFCEEVPNIYSENQNNSNMVFDDIHLIATDIVHFIYSAPLYKNFFYVHDKSDENGGRQLVVIPSKEASDDYSNRQQCKMVFFGYDDLMYICKEMSVDYVVMFFKEKTFHSNPQTQPSVQSVWLFTDAPKPLRLLIKNPPGA